MDADSLEHRFTRSIRQVQRLLSTSPPPSFDIRNLSTTIISPSQRIHHHLFTFAMYPPPPPFHVRDVYPPLPFHRRNLSTTTISPSQRIHHHDFTFAACPPPPFHPAACSPPPFHIHNVSTTTISPQFLLITDVVVFTTRGRTNPTVRTIGKFVPASKRTDFVTKKDSLSLYCVDISWFLLANTST